MLSRLIMILTLTFTSATYAEGFVYKGQGVTTNDPTRQMKDHVCLAFMMFLEARGDGEASQMFHGMATIQRALNPKQWSNDVCSVIVEPSQYESMKRAEREVVYSVMMGDMSAVDNYILSRYSKSGDLKIWYNINRIAYHLIISPDTEGWIDADHFYAPESLRRRGLETPDWILKKEVELVAGDTHFLREPRLAVN